MKRRLISVALVIGTIVTAAPSAWADTSEVVADPVVTGLSSPVFVDAPAGDDRLFIVERAGRIRILDGGSLLPTPFLDISSQVTSGGERGLLGLAFDPDYDSNGRFYVNYTTTIGSLTTRISEFTVSADPDVADSGSERILLSVEQPYSNHNGGMLAFGADGALYAGLGDGGGSGDPDDNGQDFSNVLGSIIRLDPDLPFPHFPNNNPFVGEPGHDAIWVYGMRNPWRFSIDMDGALYVGDVGQNAWEEVDFIPVAKKGANYGWNEMEGSFCYPAWYSCDTSGRELPIVDYPNLGDDCSVTGGYVYRGSELPEIDGTYLYGDFCSGAIRSFAQVGGAATEEREWGTFIGDFPGLSSFGTDGDGELYLVRLSGAVYRLVAGADRVAGSNRYGTAAALSEDAFDSPRSVAYVAVGTGFADALSAAAAAGHRDAPVLLVTGTSVPEETADELLRIDPDEIVVVGGTAVISQSVQSALGAYAPVVRRLAGADRYATAAAVSADTFSPGVPVAYVAVGTAFPDALGAAAAAGYRGGPVLLSRTDTLPPATIAELERLEPQSIVVVGGTAAIGNAVESQLAAYTDGAVTRAGGADRYETAALVSAGAFEEDRPAAFVAVGSNFPDALGAAALGASIGGPVLLTRTDDVPGVTLAELTRLGPTRIVVAGGVAVISGAVQLDLKAYETG